MARRPKASENVRKRPPTSQNVQQTSKNIRKKSEKNSRTSEDIDVHVDVDVNLHIDGDGNDVDVDIDDWVGPKCEMPFVGALS